MNRLIPILMLLTLSNLARAACDNALDFTAPKLRSTEQLNFCEAFSGKVLLVVNTASRCGFTPQFRGLEAVYKKYRHQGLEIVGFPSDDFKQEYQDANEIAEVCYVNYGVSFPMMNESSVRGPGANAFFKWLAAESGHTPQWNFNKYLVSADGRVIGAYPSHVTPLNDTLEKAIQQALQER